MDEYAWKKKEFEPFFMAVWEAKPYAISPSYEKAWEERCTKEIADEQRSKPLHNQKWMKCTGLKIETEALITAAQEQALSTKQHIGKY